MRKDTKWTIILFGTISILAFVLNLGITSGTDFHVFVFFTVMILAAIIYFYWLIKGLLNKQWFFSFKVLATPLIIIAVHFLLNYDRIKMDGKKAELYSLILGENSNYPSDFTHRGFRQIQIGMTKKELLSLVGEPLQIWPYNYKVGKTSDTLGYKYCMDGLDTHHRVRIVLLRSDTVISIGHDFYFD
jgi:hypothetical protein